MSLLYKDESEQTYEVDIKQEKAKITLLFSSDCGKFGTDEILDEHEMTAKELLKILQAHEDKQCDIPVVSKLFIAEVFLNDKKLEHRLSEDEAYIDKEITEFKKTYNNKNYIFYKGELNVC